MLDCKKRSGNGLLEVFLTRIATYFLKEFVILRVKDDAMEPKIPRGSFVGVNINEREPREGLIFAIETQEGCFIRRLLLQKGAKHFLPENPSPTNRPFYFKKTFKNPIIGRVARALNIFEENL